jgi:phage tail protein X
MTTVRTLPPAIYTVTQEDVSVDRLCFEYLLTVLGDRRQAGRVRGYIEAVLEANPGLADRGLILPRGLAVTLPEFTVDTVDSAVKRLWDPA